MFHTYILQIVKAQVTFWVQTTSCMLTTEHILTNSDHWLKNVTNSNCSSKNICLTLAIKASEFVNTHKILSFKAKINIFTACKLSFVLYSQLTVHDNCVQGLYFYLTHLHFLKT